MVKWWSVFRRKNPEFAAFEKAVAREFAFLETEFGFARTGSVASWRDIHVEYARDRVRTTVAYELESDPWLYFDLHAGRSRFEIGLATVIEAHSGSTDELAQFSSASELPDKVAALARLTRARAADVLRGDFSRLERYRQIQARSLREMNRRTFGTSTGESPRFSGRPTLAELFGDATTENLRAARAYQAVWDYSFTIPEIAAFLGVDAAAVESLLRRWEELC